MVPAAYLVTTARSTSQLRSPPSLDEESTHMEQSGERATAYTAVRTAGNEDLAMPRRAMDGRVPRQRFLEQPMGLPKSFLRRPASAGSCCDAPVEERPQS